MQSLTQLFEKSGLLLDPETAPGFTWGFLVGAVFILLIGLLVILHRREQILRDSVTVEGETGNLHITANAIREFVSRILSNYQAASLHGITLRQKRERLFLRIDMDVLPDTQVVPMVSNIRDDVFREVSEKLGITMPIRVDVSVRSLSAKEGKIERQQKRTGVAVKRRQEAPPVETELSGEKTDDAAESAGRGAVPLYSGPGAGDEADSSERGASEGAAWQPESSRDEGKKGEEAVAEEEDRSERGSGAAEETAAEEEAEAPSPRKNE